MSLSVKRIKPASVNDQLHRTIVLIGKGIRNASTYWPLRDWAAQTATKAGPKDYAGQLRAVYDDFTKNKWRYVRDPLFAEQVAVSGPAVWDIVIGNKGRGRGRGDCDDATIAIGAALSSIGFPVRLVTSTPPGAKLPAHVYPEVFVRGLNKWIAADPVLYPKKYIGDHARARSRQRWDLFGRRLPAVIGEIETMYDTKNWQDYGLENYGLAGVDGNEPADWRMYAMAGFGAYYEQMGSLDGEALGLLAEVEPDPQTGLARTPMIEVDPDDFRYLQTYGAPYDGMLALGDDGSVYEYDGMHGFFSKIFGGAKKLVSGVVKTGMGLAKKAVGIGKSLIKKLPGGKYLVKLGEKIHATSMKLVKPLLKIAGPLAKRLSPIASVIPGYGPVIAVALEAGGTAAELLTKHGIKRDPNTGKLAFKSPDQFTAFSRDIKKHAHKKRAELKAARKIWEKEYMEKYGAPGKGKGAAGPAWKPGAPTFTAAQIIKTLGYKKA